MVSSNHLVRTSHYFSQPRFQQSRRRDSGFLFRLSLPTVAPGQTPGALRFVSLALHVLPHKGGRRRRYVSARKVSEPYYHPETHFQKLPLQLPCRCTRKTRSTKQAWMTSRNQFNITTRLHIVNTPICIPPDRVP